MNNAHTTPGERRSWSEAGELHVDVRGLDCPGPLVEILRVIDNGAAATLIAHLDQEPLLLYPELEDRGWTHEVLGTGCGESDCEHGVRLRLTRLCP